MSDVDAAMPCGVSPEPQESDSRDGMARAITGGLQAFVEAAARSSHARIGIMGGTFDPIHIGHLECAEQAAAQLSLDAVVFVPAGNPHFKQGVKLAPAADRLAMCELACLPNPDFLVSDIEIAREGVTYTVDTVEAVRASMPTSTELFFILGSDAFLTLAKWKGASTLAKAVRFAVLMRPGDDCGSVERYIAEHDFSVEMVSCPLLDISSSHVRRSIADGLPIRYLVPDSVCTYIRVHGLYRADGDAHCADGNEADSTSSQAEGAPPGYPEDVYSREFADALRAELATRVSPKRFAHIEGVSQTAARLARIYGADERKAALAGLLHDWDKGYDDDGIRERVRELGLSDVIDPYVVEHMPQVLHGPTAAVALKQRFAQLPPDVVRAVYNHTTASVDAGDLEKIVYIADAIEPTRRFKDADSLRDEIGKASLDELFFRVYKFWTLALLERDKVLHPDTMTIWNTLADARRRACGSSEKKRDRKKKSKKEKGR